MKYERQVRHGGRSINVVVHPGTVLHGAERLHPLGRMSHVIIAAFEGEKTAPLRRLGTGIYKLAYTDDREFVYKVSRGYYGDLRDDDDSLRDEFLMADEFASDGHRWAAPTSLYEVETEPGYLRPVLVQPLYTVGKKFDQYSREYSRALVYIRALEYVTGDLHDGNWGLTPSGQFRVFDLG